MFRVLKLVALREGKMDVLKYRPRLRGVRILGVAGCCVAAAGVMGCFVQPMPGDVDGLSDGGTLEERSLGELVEPSIEEFLRPVGDPGEELVDGSEELDDLEFSDEEGFADLNRDGRVDEEDIATFREDFGDFAAGDEGSAADLDGDGVVTLVDFQIFLDLVAAQEAE